MHHKSKTPCHALILLALAIYSSNGLFAANASNIYGTVPPWDYLTGRFNPAQHELFVSLSAFGIPINRSPQYLRREAAKALKEMHAAFIKDHPGIRFWVQSSTRNFFDQKYIWEGKWSGGITVFGKRLDKTISDPLKRAVEILKYSSMPGGSRHHWGTDVDLNILSNSYYERGEGLVLSQWLEKNAARFGFCRPYTAERKSGHEEERWHWSYYPLAKIFIIEWNSYHKTHHRSLADPGLFLGSSEAVRLAPLYMNSINQDCE
jgi:zinc D-Ala-D-Ala carboxypeptidase